MQLSKNFYLSEMTKSDTAYRLGIENMPSSNEIENLKRLCINVLQPVRDHFKQPVIINSAYRCLKLNKAVGSSSSSQHLKGQAADIEIPGISTYDLAKWISENINYDQLILEMWVPGGHDINAGWVHCSYVASEVNRKQNLTYTLSRRYIPGLVK